MIKELGNIFEYMHEETYLGFQALYLIISLLCLFLVSDKPPIEDLQYFLEFQISRVWAPELSNLQGKDPVCQSLHFSLMGPKLYISPNQVS